MILTPRKPNRRHFRSPIREARRREREYYYAAISILVVKIILLVFLCVLLVVSIQLFTGMFPDGTFMKRFGVPLLIAGFILILIRFIIKNIIDIRLSSKKRREE
jgi:hypothetical protein